jgi:hypothetical protein
MGQRLVEWVALHVQKAAATSTMHLHTPWALPAKQPLLHGINGSSAAGAGVVEDAAGTTAVASYNMLAPAPVLHKPAYMAV